MVLTSKENVCPVNNLSIQFRDRDKMSCTLWFWLRKYTYSKSCRKLGALATFTSNRGGISLLLDKRANRIKNPWATLAADFHFFDVFPCFIIQGLLSGIDMNDEEILVAHVIHLLAIYPALHEEWRRISMVSKRLETRQQQVIPIHDITGTYQTAGCYISLYCNTHEFYIDSWCNIQWNSATMIHGDMDVCIYICIYIYK